MAIDAASDPPDATAPSAGDTFKLPYLTLRNVVGWIGISLPFVLSIGARLVGHDGLQDSISDYYNTSMHDEFVGLLFAVALFFYSYRGYATDGPIPGHLAWTDASTAETRTRAGIQLYRIEGGKLAETWLTLLKLGSAWPDAVGQEHWTSKRP